MRAWQQEAGREGRRASRREERAAIPEKKVHGRVTDSEARPGWQPDLWQGLRLLGDAARREVGRSL